MAATNFTPIQLYFSTTASAVPTAANLAQGELAINITDGKLYYEDGSGVVQVIATKGAGTIGGSTTQIQYNNAGALAGNAAMTFNSGTSTTTLSTLNLTNALGAIYGGTAQSTYAQGDILYSSATNTLAKLGIGTVNYILTSSGTVPQWVAPSSIAVLTATNLAGGLAGSVPYQSALDTTTFLAIGAANRVMTSTGTAPQWVTALTGLTGVSSSSITNTGLTSTRLVFSTTGGLETDSANLTFDGTTLSSTGYSTTGLSTLVKTVKIGDSSFNGVAVFAAATPAKLYMGTGTVTDVTSAISATNTTGAIASLAITPIAATNTGVTYTNASTLYIAGAPSAGTNVTITNPYSLYIAAGAAYLGGAVTLNGGTANGVAYLNASKVLTTGSALTFDGTNLGVANTSGTDVTLLTLTSNSGLRQQFNPTNAAGTKYNWRIDVNGLVDQTWSLIPSTAVGGSTFSTPVYQANGNGTQIWSVGATEGMRLTTTGLGIGTTSPAVKLEVAATSNGAAVEVLRLSNNGSGANTQARINFASSGTSYATLTGGYGASAPQMTFNLPNATPGNFVWQNVSVEQMRLDTVGNLTNSRAISTAYSGTNSATWVNGLVLSNTVSSATGLSNLINFQGVGNTNAVFGVTQNASGYGDFVWAGYNSAFVELGRFTSAGNLGIGTSSPNYLIDSQTTSATITTNLKVNASAAANNYAEIAFQLWSGAGSGLNTFGGSGTSRPSVVLRGLSEGSSAAGAFVVATFSGGATNAGLTEKMRVDSAGNLGLGVVPSAWGGNAKGIQITNYGSVSGNASIGTASLAANAYEYADNGWKRTNATSAGLYQISYTGAHTWSQAAASTADSIITFTQAMTLDASGNLGVGETSPSNYGKFVVTGNPASGPQMSVNSSTGQAQLNFYENTSGRFSLRTLNGSAGISFYDTFNGAEAARIDSNRNLLVGTTTAAGTASTFYSATAGQQPVSMWNGATAGNNYFFEFGTEGTYTARGSITFNRAGGLVMYNQTSDYRAKDISGPVTGSGALIDSTPVYMGKMKDATQERPMFIAHEVPAYAHTGEKDAVDADGNPVYQQMDAGALIPVMWAEIQSLRKRLAAAGIA